MVSVCKESYLVGDAGNECLDVKLGGATLLAGGVSTFEAPHGLPQGCPLTQSGVLDVIKVVFLTHTALQTKTLG